VRHVLLTGLSCLLTACATSVQTLGERALVRGDFAVAITEFQRALNEDPEGERALEGLGVAQYRSDALAAAATTVSRLLELAPRSGTALLYGGLVALRQQQDDLAADRLAQLRVIEPDPRFGAQVDRAFALLRAQPVSDETRAFIAASLEDAARAALEIRAAQDEANRAWMFSTFPVRCYPGPRAGVVCF